MLWPVGAGRRTGVADGQTKILNCDCPAVRFTPAFHFCVSSQSRATLPVSAPLVRLYSDYMHSEYGALDSDYVFVNLWSAPIGRPMRYDSVAKLVGRLRARTGIAFSPHMLRHSRATELIRSGVAIEVVSKMLTHRSVTTTSDTYVHLDVDDLRRELVRAGAWGTDKC